MLHCPKCGNENPAQNSFCQSCGTRLFPPAPDRPPASPSASQKPSAKPKAFGCLGALIGFVLSSLFGILLGQLTSLLYALVGQAGGLECLSMPLMGMVFVGSLLVSFGANRLIRSLAPKLP
jgi:hypothetical protein